MKKATVLFLTVCLAIVLGACGSSETAKNSGDTKKSAASENKKSDNDNTQEDENLKGKDIYTNNKLNINGTVGPMKYTIKSVQLKEMQPKNEATAKLLGVKVGDTVNAVTIEMSGENTSDDDVNFYLGQATIVTDTKEQLEPEMLISKHIEGEYLGKVKNEGANVYILKKSSVKNLKSIEIRVDAPTNNEFEPLGKEVKHTIKVNN
ncbi:hypothetical protein OZL92_02260 [Bacillus sonorensis]|uniref:Lipoprotein n=2 Tax=Bacillus sonorensis TaxID=119858 RepID=M5PDV0_9BACI|nr:MULTISPECIES: hypothetical protein [Bacillus]TWK79123.1 hypothetical protein CHCC20335_2061 [Bacillus paralicheniformis]ASB88200.1 hypothetical protein S101395_01691 [Bacillus sonorensis]EME75035.1 hypothetical protein BSONL12_08597 [Bacillus sonorensis L12]MBG9916060.1 hypothetical protein [Bacillus sonorensis]MCF7617599.1 hypothetical protein [Bacillus sonorensis]